MARKPKSPEKLTKKQRYIWWSLRNGLAKYPWFNWKHLGCGKRQFLDWIESQLDPDLNWDNHGKGANWYVTTIDRPIDGLTPTESECRQFSHYSNFCPKRIPQNVRRKHIETLVEQKLVTNLNQHNREQGKRFDMVFESLLSKITTVVTKVCTLSSAKRINLAEFISFLMRLFPEIPYWMMKQAVFSLETRLPVKILNTSKVLSIAGIGFKPKPDANQSVIKRRNGEIVKVIDKIQPQRAENSYSREAGGGSDDE